MYHVTDWETNEIYSSWKKLAVARRYCRGKGHNGITHNNMTFEPLCFVADDEGYLVYNPRFGINISHQVGDIVNSNDDCLRG